MAQQQMTDAQRDERLRQAFTGLAEAKSKYSSKGCKEGVYWNKIQAVKVSDGYGGKFIITEMAVMYAVDDAAERGFRAGEEFAVFFDMDGDYFLRDVKNLLMGSFGITESSLAEMPVEQQEKELLDAAMEATSSRQAMKGILVEFKAVRRLKKGKPVDSTNPQDYYMVKTFERPVSATELKAKIDAKIEERFFPNGLLTKLVAKEATA